MRFTKSSSFAEAERAIWKGFDAAFCLDLRMIDVRASIGVRPERVKTTCLTARSKTGEVADVLLSVNPQIDVWFKEPENDELYGKIHTNVEPSLLAELLVKAGLSVQ